MEDQSVGVADNHPVCIVIVVVVDFYSLYVAIRLSRGVELPRDVTIGLYVVERLSSAVAMATIARGYEEIKYVGSAGGKGDPWA